MSPKRVAWIAVTAALLYAGFTGFVLANFEMPELSAAALVLVGGAAGAQIAAKWFFGLLFKVSVEQSGGRLRARSAFRAALVGAGVARLIPAGGAITPVAMSWTIREEEQGTTVAALRTVLLNYAGLLMLAGLGLLLARPRQSAQVFSVSLTVLAPFVFFAGVLLMFGSGRLRSLSKLLPKSVQRRLSGSVVDHPPGPESQVYLWSRLILEAAALGLVLVAFRIDANVFQIAAAFSVSQLAGGLPGTPGGMGIVEAGLVFILSAYGFPTATTVAPVLVFRVVSYWLPAGLGFFTGGMTFLSSPEAKAASEGEVSSRE